MKKREYKIIAVIMTSLIITLTFLLRCSGNKLEEDYKKLKDKMDGTKCEGKGCPFKEECYRFTAPVNEYRQSYFINVPYNKETNTCKHLWKI